MKKNPTRGSELGVSVKKMRAKVMRNLAKSRDCIASAAAQYEDLVLSIEVEAKLTTDSIDEFERHCIQSLNWLDEPEDE